MAGSAVLLVAEDVLERLLLRLSNLLTSQLLMRKNHLGEVVVQELADPVAEEAVGEHVRDLLQVLRLDGTHVANVFLLQNVEGCSRKEKRGYLTIRIVFAIVLSIGKISVWCLLRRVNGPGRGKRVSQPGSKGLAKTGSPGWVGESD